MRLFGVTGGIGMGKSTAGKWLRQRGVEVADTDEIAHQLTEPGQSALEQIDRRFGPEMLSPEGRLNRAELAKAVFTDAGARADLEAILHPRIRTVWEAEVEKWRTEGRTHAAVLIPLLFETGAESRFDAVICVACSEASQWQRLRNRGWSEDHIRQRLAAQWPVEKKIAQSNFVVWTDTTMEAHSAQLEQIWFQRPITSSATSAGRA